jgi:hypothetical protein
MLDLLFVAQTKQLHLHDAIALRRGGDSLGNTVSLDREAHCVHPESACY